MKPFVSLRLSAAVALTVSVTLGQAAQAGSDALVWYHFAGTAQLASDSNSATLRKVAALPESGVLLDQVLGKLAQTPFHALRAELPKEAQDPPNLWRPLLEDVLSAESVGAVRDGGGHLELALAVRLPDARADFWNTHWTNIVRAWKLSEPVPVKANEASGWQARNATNSLLIQMVRVRNWVVVGVGREPLVLAPSWAHEIAQSGQPASALQGIWLEGRLDCPRLGHRFPVLALLGLPPCELQVTAKGGTLRTTARWHYPEKLAWKPEPWRMPTNTISEPLISFTVARGIAPWLTKIPGFSELGLDAVPNQITLWGQSHPHVQSCASIPVASATNAILKLRETLQPWVARRPNLVEGNFLWLSNATAIILEAAPFVFPVLSTLHESAQDYLLGYFFQPMPGNKPVPPELYGQVLGRNGLMYYDWEETTERLPQMSRLWQLIDISKERMLPETNAPSFRWLLTAAPLLGNTLTEVTQTGDQEATLFRRSHLGLTAFEIVMVLRWADGRGFPLTFDPPPSTTAAPNPLPAPAPERSLKPPVKARKR